METKKTNDNLVAIHYSEIGLKGGKRPFFERVLRENIQNVIPPTCSVSVAHKRLFVSCEKSGGYAAILKRLGDVFGIAWFASASRIKPTREATSEFIERCGKDILKDAKTFRITSTRVDKSFPLTSSEIENVVGQQVVDRFGVGVDLTRPDTTIYVEVLPESIFIYTEKHEGLRGLPVGSSGRVLSLFSGGIDSPVASWLMMRRGCRADYIHFHALRSSNEIKGSKIEKLLEILTRYGGASTVFFVPFSEFHARILDVDPRYELLLFRRFIIKLSERLAQKRRYEALVMGDSVGQVASQTLPYLRLTDRDTSLPILRPLVGHTKEEITALARRIGTYEASIEDYKDCCSIVSAHPTLHPREDILKQLEKKIDLTSIIKRTIEQTEERTIGI